MPRSRGNAESTDLGSKAKSKVAIKPTHVEPPKHSLVASVSGFIPEVVKRHSRKFYDAAPSRGTVVPVVGSLALLGSGVFGAWYFGGVDVLSYLSPTAWSASMPSLPALPALPSIAELIAMVTPYALPVTLGLGAIAGLSNHIRILNKKNAELTGALKLIREGKDKNLNERKADLDKFEEKLDAANEELDAANEELDAANVKLAAAQAKLAADKKALKTDRTALNKEKKTIANTAKHQKGKQTQLDAKEARLADKARGLADKENELNAFDEELEGAEQALDQAKEEFEAAKAAFEKEKEEFAAAKAAFDAEKTRIELPVSTPEAPPAVNVDVVRSQGVGAPILHSLKLKQAQTSAAVAQQNLDARAEEELSSSSDDEKRRSRHASPVRSPFH